MTPQEEIEAQRQYELHNRVPYNTIARLQTSVNLWQECGNRIMKAAFGKAAPLSDSDVIGLITSLRQQRDDLLAVCEKFVRKFEDGWPSHATGSIGGLGHMPEQECNACKIMPVYDEARRIIARKVP